MTTIFVDVPEAATLLGISVKAFRRRYIYKNLIRVMRMGRTPTAKNRKDILLREDVAKLKRA